MAAEVTIGGTGELFVGEDKALRLHVLDTDGVPVDIAAWLIKFYVRKTDKTPDPALLEETATVTGVYDADPDANTQRAVVILTDTELAPFVAKTYRHSWKRMDDGFETVLAYGDFVMQKATAP